jgi:hypothetical protein
MAEPSICGYIVAQSVVDHLRQRMDVQLEHDFGSVRFEGPEGDRGAPVRHRQTRLPRLPFPQTIPRPLAPCRLRAKAVQRQAIESQKASLPVVNEPGGSGYSNKGIDARNSSIRGLARVKVLTADSQHITFGWIASQKQHFKIKCSALSVDC